LSAAVRSASARAIVSFSFCRVSASSRSIFATASILSWRSISSLRSSTSSVFSCDASASDSRWSARMRPAARCDAASARALSLGAGAEAGGEEGAQEA
jgi:hypothetical protein